MKQLNSPRLRVGGPSRSNSIFKSAENMHIRAVAHNLAKMRAVLDGLHGLIAADGGNLTVLAG